MGAMIKLSNKMPLRCYQHPGARSTCTRGQQYEF